MKFILLFFMFINHSEQLLKLKQVLILSRHGVRTPLSQKLTEMTPKEWPKWNEKCGHLTARGAELEGFMGVFFSSWLNQKGLITKQCPSDQDLFVYSNVKQRTMASAYAFTSNAYPNCNITIHHATENDPVFNPVIHNSTETFQRIAVKKMEERLKTLQLNKSYTQLEDILNYRQSKLCVVNKECDLTTDENKLILLPNFKPNIDGPLKIANSVLDAFIMEYYNGMSDNIVAWGELSQALQWKNIIKLSKGYHNVIFNTTLIAQDIAKPLIRYISDIILDSNSPKVSVLMGHDANMYTILSGLKFRPYILKNQYELCPVSGKIVFQKWYDELNHKFLLKVDYVYQSTEQLRNVLKLTLASPPQFEPLVLQGCDVDENGYCSWDDFVNILMNL